MIAGRLRILTLAGAGALLGAAAAPALPAAAAPEQTYVVTYNSSRGMDRQSLGAAGTVMSELPGSGVMVVRARDMQSLRALGGVTAVAPDRRRLHVATVGRA